MTFRIIPFLLLLLAVSIYGGPLVAPLREGMLSTEPVPMLSNLTCQENGIFIVNESCQEFYHCCDWDGSNMQIYHFTCPQGTVFDNLLDTCNSPDMVSTRSACVTETMQDDVGYAVRNPNLMPVIKRTKRSLTNEENCTQQDVEIAAESAKDTCILIYHVDKYVNRVKSMIPVRIPEYITDEGYKSIMDDYNNYLENAQNHSDIWHNGDDIMSGIKLIYELARLFGPEFQRKFQIVQNRLEKLQTAAVDPEIILNLENAIVELKEENTKHVAIITGDIPEALKIYFLNQIKRNLEQIEKKEKQLSDLNLPVTKKLKEMVGFMEFVRDDASRIEAKANSTRAKLKDFKDHVGKDSTAFKKSMETAKLGISSLEDEKNNTMEFIKSNKARKQKLELERQRQRDEMKDKEDEMNEELEEMKRFLARNSLSSMSANDRHSSGSVWMILPVIGWIVGGIKMSQASADLQRLTQQRASNLKALDTQIKSFEARISVKDERIYNTTQTIESYEKRIQNKTDEIKKLTFVDFYLGIVMNESEMIIPFITKAMKSLSKMEDMFDNIVFKLEELIYKAKEIKGQVASEDLKKIILVDLTGMMIHWNSSYADIISLGQCTRPEFIHLLTQPPESITTTTELSVNSTGTAEPITTTTILSVNSTGSAEPITTTTILSVNSTEGVEPQTSLIAAVVGGNNLILESPEG